MLRRPATAGPADPWGHGGLVSEILRVNPIACTAHGICAELLPEVIQLDPWGYPIVMPGELDGERLSHARRAVAACPALALVLEKGRR